MRIRKKASNNLAIFQRAATATAALAVATVAVSLSWLLVCRGCLDRQFVLTVSLSWPLVCRSFASLWLAVWPLRLAVASPSLACGNGPGQSIHLAATFSSQGMVIVVVLKWGNK